MNKLLRFISNAILYLFIGSMLMVCSECVYLGVKYVENGPRAKAMIAITAARITVSTAIGVKNE